jgi:hypothetical protein
MEFEALFWGRYEKAFKDKETKEMVPYYSISLLPSSRIGEPILVKANKEGFDAYADVEPLEPVKLIFTLSKDGVMRIIG